MSVWISDEKLLIFASLISASKMSSFEKKYQTFDTVFHHQMKHLEVRQKYSATRRIFNSLLGVSSCDETLRLMFDILPKRLLQISIIEKVSIKAMDCYWCRWYHISVSFITSIYS